ncbi:MAG: class I SAM-dependent methyltransferase [Deltaproteobacteria bacterium]|nr:class I SAM-dependent methyltransferase [Deltaproteobacteria bacterium]
MAEPTLSFSGSIPQLYDRYLGPVLFEPYAIDLARRVAAHGAGPVLEMACGTGIVTRQLRAHLSPSVKIIATDLSQPMLDYAQVKLGTLQNVDWQQADIAALPFPDTSFPTVVCQFGLMFVPDKQAAFREARRVLSKGGLFAFNVWDTIATNPFVDISHKTLARLFPADPPQFFTPFIFNDHHVLRQLLTTNGFANVQLETVTFPAHSESAKALATGFLQGSPLSAALQDRGASLDAITDAVAQDLAQHGGAAPFRSTLQAVVVTAQAGGA